MHGFDIEPVVTAVRDAGDRIEDGFWDLSPDQVEEKNRGDYVTDYDRKSEDMILTAIQNEFPDHGFIAEETGERNTDADYLWVVDPLDGTTNFSTKNPFFNVSVALVNNQVNRIEAGIVYAPITGELFRADYGNGTTLNGDPVNVSQENELDHGFIAFCAGYPDHARERAATIYRDMRTETGSLRQVGAAALELAYVACGRFDAFYMNDMNPWDVAAGALLVREAGGLATDFTGSSFTLDSQDLVASNGEIHTPLVKRLRQY